MIGIEELSEDDWGLGARGAPALCVKFTDGPTIWGEDALTVISVFSPPESRNIVTQKGRRVCLQFPEANFFERLDLSYRPNIIQLCVTAYRHRDWTSLRALLRQQKFQDHETAYWSSKKYSYSTQLSTWSCYMELLSGGFALCSRCYTPVETALIVGITEEAFQNALARRPLYPTAALEVALTTLRTELVHIRGEPDRMVVLQEIVDLGKLPLQKGIDKDKGLVLMDSIRPFMTPWSEDYEDGRRDLIQLLGFPSYQAIFGYYLAGLIYPGVRKDSWEEDLAAAREGGQTHLDWWKLTLNFSSSSSPTLSREQGGQAVHSMMTAQSQIALGKLSTTSPLFQGPEQFALALKEANFEQDRIDQFKEEAARVLYKSACLARADLDHECEGTDCDPANHATCYAQVIWDDVNQKHRGLGNIDYPAVYGEVITYLWHLAKEKVVSFGKASRRRELASLCEIANQRMLPSTNVILACSDDAASSTYRASVGETVDTMCEVLSAAIGERFTPLHEKAIRANAHRRILRALPKRGAPPPVQDAGNRAVVAPPSAFDFEVPYLSEIASLLPRERHQIFEMAARAVALSDTGPALLGGSTGSGKTFSCAVIGMLLASIGIRTEVIMDSRASCNMMYESLTGVPLPTDEDESRPWLLGSVAYRVQDFLLENGWTGTSLIGVTHGEVLDSVARSGGCKLTTSLSLGARYRLGHRPELLIVDEADGSLASASQALGLARTYGARIVFMSATLGTHFGWVSPTRSVPGPAPRATRHLKMGPMSKCLPTVLAGLAVPDGSSVLLIVSSIAQGQDLSRLVPPPYQVSFFDGLLSPSVRRAALLPPEPGVLKLIIATSSVARADLKRVAVVLCDNSLREYGMDSFGRSFVISMEAPPGRNAQWGGRAGRRGEPVARFEGRNVHLILFGAPGQPRPSGDLVNPLQLGHFFAQTGTDPNECLLRLSSEQAAMCEIGHTLTRLGAPNDEFRSLGYAALCAYKAARAEGEWGFEMELTDQVGTLIALVAILEGGLQISEAGGERLSAGLGRIARALQKEFLMPGFAHRLMVLVTEHPLLFGHEGQALISAMNEILASAPEEEILELLRLSTVDEECIAWCCPHLVAYRDSDELVFPGGRMPFPSWARDQGPQVVIWRLETTLPAGEALLEPFDTQAPFPFMWEGFQRIVGRGLQGVLIERLGTARDGHAERLDYLVNRTSQLAAEGDILGIKTEGWSLADVLSVLLLTFTREFQGEALHWILQEKEALKWAHDHCTEVDATRVYPELAPLIGAVQASFQLVKFGMSQTKTLFSVVYGRPSQLEEMIGAAAVVTGGDDGGSIIMAQIPFSHSVDGPGMVNFLQELGFISLVNARLSCKIVYHLKTRLWARAVKALSPGLRLGNRHPLRVIGELMGLDKRSPDAEHVGPTLRWLVEDSVKQMLLDPSLKVNLAPLANFFGIVPSPSARKVQAEKGASMELQEAFRRLGPSNSATTEEGMSVFMRALEEVSVMIPAGRLAYEKWIRWAEANGGLCYSLPRKERVFYPHPSTWKGLLKSVVPITDTEGAAVPSWFLRNNPDVEWDETPELETREFLTTARAETSLETVWEESGA